MVQNGSANRLRRTASVAALLAAGLGGCKKHQPTPTAYTLPPSATMPAAPEDAYFKQQQKALVDLVPFPLLGDPALTKLPTGEVWVKYPCGIMVQDLRPRDEYPPEFGQFVTITYTEYLSDNEARIGRIVKQQKADDPWKFRLGSKSVIPGLSMGLSTMKRFTRRRIFIPPEFAYGDKGDPETGIGPNQPLIFDVELLRVTGEAVPNLPPKPEFIGPPAPKNAAPPATAP